MPQIRVPGIVYSMLLAAGDYAVQYFTVGAGEGIPWRTIVLAAIPLVIKLFTVNAPEQPTPQADIGGGPLPQRHSKAKRLWLG